jgi:hypothetical protein
MRCHNRDVDAESRWKPGIAKLVWLNMSLEKAPHVTIIVVTFKALNDTLECLDSISKMTYSNLRVILVDQNSQDGTVEAVRGQFPRVDLIENLTNDGFTGGNNLGLRAAMEQPTAYVLLLNNDTIVEPGLLEKLLAPMETDMTVGIIGPTMLFYKEPNTICWAGSYVDWRGWAHIYGYGQLIGAIDMQPRETGYVAGCGMMIRRALLEEVGFFDNRFFIYYEEVDLCARARRAGWRVMYLPSAKMWHKISRVTELLGRDFALYHMQRNRLLYLWKDGNPRLLCCLWCIASGLRAAVSLCLKGERHQEVVLLRALRDSLSNRWGNTFFSYM